MHILRKTAILASACAVLGVACTSAQAQSRYGQPVITNQYAPQHASNMVSVDRYGRPIHANQQVEPPKKYKNLAARLRGEKNIYYQKPPPPGMFQQWVDWEPEYTLVAGDQLDIVVSSAPELSRTLTVGPDGRVVMPMSRPIMAAGRTFTQVQNELTGELGKQLRDPRLTVTPRAYSPEQIFVGGQVGQPGTYTLPGRIGAVEAIFMAGGFGQGARAKQVAVLRRGPNGAMMMRAVNIQGGIRNIREYNDNIQLRRGDIIFVPRTNLAEVGAFVQAVRQTFPVDFNLSYQFGSNNGGTTVISP